MIQTESRNTKFILIHGFGGGVHEVMPLAEHLISMGFEAACPLLKGHSSTRKQMQMVKYEDWIDSVEKELLRMKESNANIIMIGFSMGGLIAFNLACKYNIKAIITINTPIYYYNPAQIFRNVFDDIKCRKFNHCKRYFVESGNFPMNSLVQFLKLLRKTKPLLNNVKCPVLIIQAEDDDTVRRKSVDYISYHLSSQNKLIKCFSTGGHAILLSPEAGHVITYVNDYLHTSVF